jgi:hypothetical protein
MIQGSSTGNLFPHVLQRLAQVAILITALCWERGRLVRIEREARRLVNQKDLRACGAVRTGTSALPAITWIRNEVEISPNGG